MKKITAVYPGTFDPVTNGHLDVIERAATLFDEVVVCIAINSAKTPLFTKEERSELLQESVSNFSNVQIDTFEGLLVKYAEEKNASVIIRGLRAVSDFEYEFQLSLTNRKLSPSINTIFVMPNEKYTYLNSSLIRELASYNADIQDFVPPHVHDALRLKFGFK